MTFQTTFLIILTVSHPTAFEAASIKTQFKLIEARWFFSPSYIYWHNQLF